MSNDPFLRRLLEDQKLGDAELATLRRLRDDIQRQLSGFQGSPRFYYGGSYGKDTIIRAKYDLDIVMYWPHESRYTLEDIFGAVGKELQKHWAPYVQPQNVAWTIPFQGGFHVDVVPGRALDASFKYANLYRSKTGTPLQTSIKVHIDVVRKSGRRELIRLLKLWKQRRGVPVKSFVLEVLAVEGARGTSLAELEPQLSAALIHLRDHINDRSIPDPANSNNNLADAMTAQEKTATSAAAAAAIAARTWDEVFR